MSAYFPPRSGAVSDTTVPPYVMIPACIPLAFESVYSSIGVPSGSFPKACFFTLEFPFLAVVCATQANAAAHIRTPVIRRICLMNLMVSDLAPAPMPFAAAQPAGVDDHCDDEDQQIQARERLVRIH